jgi:hypothetical protein
VSKILVSATVLLVLSISLIGTADAQQSNTFTDPSTGKTINLPAGAQATQCNPSPQSGHTFCLNFGSYTFGYFADAPASSNDPIRAAQDMLAGLGFSMQPLTAQELTTPNGIQFASYGLMTGQDVLTSNLLSATSVVQNGVLYTLAFPSSAACTSDNPTCEKAIGAESEIIASMLGG